MANFKSSLVLAFLSFGMISINPAMGQSTVSTLDFWLTFAELLTGDLLTDLSQAELPNLIPNIALPTLPNVVLPNIVIPDIIFPDINLSGAPVPPPASRAAPVAPTPVAPNPAPVYPYDPYYYYAQSLLNLRPSSTQAPGIIFPTFPATTAAPATTTKKPDGCEPEKVRIIVVSECDDKKSQESSESSESSEEAQVIIPYQKRGRYHFQNPSKH